MREEMALMNKSQKWINKSKPNKALLVKKHKTNFGIPF